MQTEKEKEELVFLGVKVPRSMLELIEKAVATDTHIDKSEFMRDAIRKELMRRGLL